MVVKDEAVDFGRKMGHSHQGQNRQNDRTLFSQEGVVVVLVQYWHYTKHCVAYNHVPFVNTGAW